MTNPPIRFTLDYFRAVEDEERRKRCHWHLLDAHLNDALQVGKAGGA